MKKCTVCKESKSIDQFRKAKGYKDGIFSVCKSCESDRLREWRKANPDKVQKQNARANSKRKINQTGYYDPNRQEEWTRAKKNAHLVRKYGFGIEEFERLSEKQGDRCTTCQRSTDEIWLCVDHCHISEEFRGLLCSQCNSALGYVRDDLETLKRMIEYLKMPRSALVTDR